MPRRWSSGVRTVHRCSAQQSVDAPSCALDPEDVLAALRKDAQHRRRPAVGAGHQIADPQRPDRAASRRRHDRLIDRLRAAPHECQRRDLDLPALEVRGDLLGVEHVVQRVEQRPQVRVDLRHQVAGQEAQALARLDRGAGEDDPVDLAAGSAAAASATARNVLPVPAGPIPNVIVLVRIEST